MGQGDEEDDGWEETTKLVKVERFRILLCPSASTTAEDIPHPTLPAFKDIVAVYADFYAYLYERARVYITETHANGDLLWPSFENDVDIVLSHPNGWDGPQQATMRKAAIQAGLVPNTRDGHERVKFVSEGEAVFHFSVMSGRLGDVIQTGDNVMVIDAGRQRVNLIAYAFANTTPIEIKEIAPPSVIFEGSDSVTYRAREYLASKLANSRFGTQAYVDNITEAFYNTTMKRFKGAGDTMVKFSSIIADRDPKVGIRNGQIKLTEEEMVALFAPAVKGIISAIEAQRASAGESLVIT
ncbi:hypothetical protein OF83DRAFT_1288952, partial [Amylostereum chailletii]